MVHRYIKSQAIRIFALLMLCQTITQPAAQGNPVTDNLAIILTQADKFDTFTEASATAFKPSIDFFNNDTNLLALTSDQSASLNIAINTIRYSPFSFTTPTPPAQPSENIAKLISSLDLLIPKLDANSAFPNNFQGRKKQLQTYLKIYKMLSKEDINTLITQKKILPANDIIGTDENGTGGLLARLVSERMQENFENFKTSDNTPICASLDSADIQKESPGRSWRAADSESSETSFALRSLISLAGTVLTPYATSTEMLSTVCNNLNSKLDADITFEERITALTSQINDDSLAITDPQSAANFEGFKRFLINIRRIIKSIDNTTTKAQKNSAIQVIQKFVNKTNIAFSLVKNEQDQLGRDALILDDKMVVGLSISSTTNNPQYLSIQNSVLSISNSGLMGAVFFKISCLDDYIYLEIPSSFDIDGASGSSSSTFYYLKNDSGKLVVGTITGKTNSFANSSVTERRTYFGTGPNADKDYKFQAYGSINQISILSVATGGFLTQTLDQTIRTAVQGSDGILSAFKIDTDQTGKLIQSPRNSFTTAKIAETARILKKGRSTNFSNTTVVSSNYSSKTNSDVQSLAISIMNDSLEKLKTIKNSITNNAAQSPHYKKLELAVNNLSNTLNKYSVFTETTSNTAANAYSYIMENINNAIIALQALDTPIPDSLNNLASQGANKYTITTTGIAGAIQTLQTAANKASSEDDSAKEMVIEELLFLLNTASSSDEPTYKELTKNSNTSTIDKLIQGIETDFAEVLTKNQTLKQNLVQTKYKWDFIKSTPYTTKTVSSKAPQIGQTIALKVVDTSSSGVEKFLVATPVQDINNKTSYILSIQATIPTDATTHLVVSGENSLFGFQSALANNLYLSVKTGSDKQTTTGSIKSESDFTFTDIATDNNNIKKPFIVPENQPMQFLIENSSTGNGIYLKSVLTSTYVGTDATKNTPKMLTTGTTNILILAPVLVNSFYKQLGIINLEQDDAQRLQKYSDLMQFIDTTESLKYFILDLQNFLILKKKSSDLWNKFITDSAKLTALQNIINKLSVIINNLAATDKASMSTTLEALKNELQSGFVESLDDLKTAKAIALKWTDSKGKVFYLKEQTKETTNATGAKTTTTILSFAASTITEPGIKIKAIVQSDDTVQLQMMDSSKFIKINNTSKQLELVEQTASQKSSNTIVGTLFKLKGPHNEISLTTDSYTNSFVGIKTVTDIPSIYEGFLSRDIITPLPSQQVFGLEILSDRELAFIQAARLCDLQDAKWIGYDTGANAWNATQSAELLAALSKRINAYESITTQILTDQESSLDDKKLLIDEVKNFVTAITSVLHGHAYVEIVGDENISNILENNIFSNLNNISTGNPTLQSSYNEMMATWQGGYTGSSAFKTGDQVAIKVTMNNDASYLNIIETSYQGSKYYMIQPGETFLGTTDHFEIATYKDKIIFKSTSLSNQALAVQSLSEDDKRLKPLTRLKLQPLPISQSGKIDFTQENTLPFQFTFETESSTNTNTLEKTGKLISVSQNVALAIDTSDNNFAKMTNLISNTTSAINTFSIIKLDPFHIKLSEAYIATTAKDAVTIFSKVLTDDYINNTPQAELFAKTVAQTFDKFRKDATQWTTFLSDPSNTQLLADFSATLDAKESVLGPTQKALVLAALSGSATVNLTEFKNIFLSLSWKDVDNSEFFLYTPNNTSLEWSGTSKINIKSHVKLETVTGNQDQVFIVFNINNKKYYIGLEQSSSNLILSETIRQPFVITGSANKYSLKSPTEDKYLTLVLSTDNTTKATTKTVNMQPGSTAADNTSRPTMFQSFNIYKNSAFERSLAIAKESNVVDRIAYYNTLLSDQSKKLSDDDLKLIVSEVGIFITTYTADKALFDSLKNNSQSNTSLLQLFKTLKTSISSNKDLTANLEQITDSWNEGYVGSPSENTPLNGNVVIFQSSENAYLKTIETKYQDNSLIQLQATSDNQLDPDAHFTITVYKDKFGIEATAKPGYFLCATPTPKADTDKNTPLYRLTFMPLGNNSAGNPLKFGALGSENFQFKLNPVSTATQNFKLYSVGLSSEVFFDEADQGFARTISMKTGATTPTASSLLIILETPLHKKLQQLDTSKSDAEILNQYNQILQNNFVTNIDNAKLFASSISLFIKAKSTDAATWEAFVSAPETSKALKQILDILRKNSLFESSIKQLEESLGKGFVQDFNDGDFITIKWGSVTNPKYLKAVTKDSNILLKVEDSSTAAAKEADAKVTLNALFKIKKTQFNNKPYIQLLYEDNNQEYVLSIQDSGSKGSYTRVPAKFVLLNTITNDTEKQKTLFDYQGSLTNMSFKSIRTSGFLSLGATTNNVATMSEASSQSKSAPAGDVIGQSLMPGAFEQFVISVMTEYDRELFIISNPTQASDVQDNIYKFLKYPTFFQEKTATILKNDADNKSKMLTAVEKFVNNVVSTKTLADAVNKDDDKTFKSLIEVLRSLNFSTEDQKRIDSIDATWLRGFSPALGMGVPGNGKNFIWMVTGASTASSTTNPTTKTSTQDNCTTLPKVIKIIKDELSDTYKVSTINLTEALKTFSGDERIEQFIKLNDPLEQSATFKMMMGRDVIGITSEELIKNNLILKIDPTVSFPDNKITVDLWQQAAAFFAKGDFDDLNPQNPTYLKVTKKPTGYILEHAATTGAVLSVGADGLIRIFKTTNNTTANITSISSAEPNETFKLIELKEFHQQLLKTKSIETTDASFVTSMKQAIKMVKTQDDLDILVNELCRIIISKKDSKQNWDTFIGNKEAIKALQGLFQLTISSFGNQSVGNLTINPVLLTMMNRQLSFLAGTLYPNFVKIVEVEAEVLSFDDALQNLKSKLNSLDDTSLQSFLDDINETCQKLMEKNLSNTDTTTPSNNFDTSAKTIADWLEFEVAEAEVIKNNNKQDIISNLVAKYRTDYKFADIVAALSFMLDKFQGFSDDRFLKFISVMEKTTDPKILTKALTEGYALDSLRQILRRSMANQCKPHLDKPYTKNNPSWWPAKSRSITTYRNYMLATIDLLTYPIQKGKTFIQDIDTRVKAIVNMASLTSPEAINSLNIFYDILKNWDASIGSGLVLADVNDITAIKSSSNKEATLKTLKSSYLATLNNSLASFTNKLSTSDIAKATADRFTTLITAITNVIAQTKSATPTLTTDTASTASTPTQVSATTTSSTGAPTNPSAGTMTLPNTNLFSLPTTPTTVTPATGTLSLPSMAE